MSTNQELVIHQGSALAATDEAQRFLPVMSLAVAKERREMVVQAISALMHEANEANNFEGDYCIIPGTKKKNLLQPGADKLNNLFGLVPTFIVLEKELDWTGERHGGEPFFYYETKCRLMRGDFCMGEGDGSANSWESKYRYRTAERVCPECGKENIRKSKQREDGSGGGWYCWKKTDGCGATFRDGDPAIESQESGKKPNPDIADVVNTLLKMANKRAKVAATINATSAHEFFSQDHDDIRPQTRESNGGTRSAVPQSGADAYNEKLRQSRKTIDEAGATGEAYHTQPKAQNANEMPQELTKLWARMKNIATVVEVFGELKSEISSLSGNENDYYMVLKRHGFEHANQIKDLQKARQCVRDVYAVAVEWRKANEPQEDDSRFHVTDADMPEEVAHGGK